jgi:hypothetical protein
MPAVSEGLRLAERRRCQPRDALFALDGRHSQRLVRLRVRPETYAGLACPRGHPAYVVDEGGAVDNEGGCVDLVEPWECGHAASPWKGRTWHAA